MAAGAIEWFHGAASRIRRWPFLAKQRWLWSRVEPTWNSLLDRATRERGILVHVNGDRLRLTYTYGARYSKTGYEPRVHDVFARGIEPEMVVFDIGAHIGFFTLAAALRVGPNGRVLAFEPAPDTAATLARHVAMNGWHDRVEIIEAVVSDKEGSVPFYVHGETMAAALIRENIELLSPEEFDSSLLEIEISSVTLDSVCATRGIQPDRIKIDVEGAELLVLQGAASVLRSRAEVLCELHPNAMSFFGYGPADLEALVLECGRRLERIDDPNELGIFHALIVPA